MRKYSYDGPVMEFNRCIANRWQGSTYAVSPDKARSNLAFQFKNATKRTVSTRITLPGKLIVADEKEEAV